MKLRNKKTGEIVESWAFVSAKYNSLTELNEEWEDYKPAKPLIKNDKIRETIKVWAKVNKVKEVLFDKYWYSFRDMDLVISFLFSFKDLDGLEDGKTYTIAELCGEEEE